jgi:hypothetical protein
VCLPSLTSTMASLTTLSSTEQPFSHTQTTSSCTAPLHKWPDSWIQAVKDLLKSIWETRYRPKDEQPESVFSYPPPPTASSKTSRKKGSKELKVNHFAPAPLTPSSQPHNPRSWCPVDVWLDKLCLAYIVGNLIKYWYENWKGQEEFAQMGINIFSAPASFCETECGFS